MNIVEAMKLLKSGEVKRIYRKCQKAISISIYDNETWHPKFRVGLEFGDILAEDWEVIK